MTDKIFEVEIAVYKTVRVRVPVDIVKFPGEIPEDIAEEFALGGKSTWPDQVISEHVDYDVESIREIVCPEKAELPSCQPL